VVEVEEVEAEAVVMVVGAIFLAACVSLCKEVAAGAFLLFVVAFAKNGAERFWQKKATTPSISYVKK
jgi:hypothetical protein